MDVFDQYASQLSQDEYSYDQLTAWLGISRSTLNVWMRDSQVQGLRPNIYRKHWSVDRNGIAQILRTKQVPLDQLGTLA